MSISTCADRCARRGSRVLVLSTARGGVLPRTRAFSLYFDVLPVIVVNGADGPRGRLFSMLHEYAHLLPTYCRAVRLGHRRQGD